MKGIFARTGIALALGATAIASAAPAQAQGYRYRSHHGSDAGTAIVAGIAGLAIGAAIASSSHRNDGYRGYNGYDNGYDAYDDGRYQEPRPVYRQDYRGDGGYAYRQGYDGYAGRVCTVERSWDRYSRRSVLVRVCR